MEAFNIISANKVKDDSITLTITDPVSGVHFTRRYADIRMGIHWPTSQSPACLVVVSQEYKGHHKSGEAEPPVGRREVIAEYISASLGMNEFYREIVVLAQKTSCRRLYAILPEDRLNYGHLQDLEKFARQADCDIYVDGANDGDDFFLSISRIKDSIDSGALVIPAATEVFDQLKSITRDDLQDNPQERFYSIDALGHVLDGYYRSPPKNYPLINKLRQPPDWRYH